MVLIIVIAGMAASIYLLFLSGHLSVADIQVNSADEILEAKVRDAVYDWLGEKRWGIAWRNNLLFLPVDKLIGNLLRSFPKINKVEIAKSYPHGLMVIIEERKIAGTWCLSDRQPEECFYFDRQGVVFREAAPSVGFLVFNVSDFRKRELVIGQQVEKYEWLEVIFTAKFELEKNGVKASKFIIPLDSFDEFWAETGTGWKIFFSINTDIPKQIGSLAAFLKKQKETAAPGPNEYVDLRIQDRIYYK